MNRHNIPPETLVRGLLDVGDISDDARVIALALLAVAERLEGLEALWLITPDQEEEE